MSDSVHPLDDLRAEDLKRTTLVNTLVLLENYIYAIVDAARSSDGQRLKQTNAERMLLIDHIMLLGEMLKDDGAR